MGLGALLLPDRQGHGPGPGFQSVPCCLSAGRKPGMQKASPTPGISDCLMSLSFLIYKTKQKNTCLVDYEAEVH